MNHTATRSIGDDTLVYGFAYDGNGVLLSVADAFDNTLYLNYDASGYVNLIEAPGGQLSALEINATSQTLDRLSYEDGSAYDFVYDANALMRFESEPERNTFEHVFDGDGRITSVIDPEGGVWGYETNTHAAYDESIISYPENEQSVYRSYPPSNGFWESTATYADGETTRVKTSEDTRSVIKEQCGVIRTEHYHANHPPKQRQTPDIAERLHAFGSDA